MSNKLVNGNSTLFCCYNTSIGHNTSKTTKQQINSIIIEYFQNYIERHNTVLFIKIWTEWVNPDSSLNYRADPDYRQTGPWYNWCMVEWGDDPKHSNGDDMNLNVNNNITIHSVPAKILCFYTVGDGVAKALVHSCHYQSTNDINTATTEQWRLQYQKINGKLEPMLETISVEVISGRVMVIENDYTLEKFVSKDKAESKILLIKD